MNVSVKSFSTICLCSGLLLTGLSFPTHGQDFWSPRHVVLDTYTEPVPFLCDGDLLLAYELHITNMDRLPISLASVDVLADDSPTPAKAYSGEQLIGSLTRIRVEGQSDVVSEVMGGQRAILHVLLSYTGKDALPSVLKHRIRYSFLKDDGSEVGATVEGGTIRVAQEREAVVIGAPLGEGIWLATRSVSRGLSGHRRGAIRPQNGIPYQKARYAIDFAGFDSTGAAYHGSQAMNEKWVGYGAEVLAMADGRVVSIRDGLPDSQPFDTDRLKSLTGETLGGNVIVLDIGNDLFAFYGHLQPGSIVVQEGDQVCKGQVLGRVGNSGNSDAPHLHFQINRDIPIRGEAVPYVFEEYEHLGVCESNWAFNTNTLFEEVADRTITRLQTRSMGRIEAAGQEPPIVDALVSASIRSSMTQSASKASAPEWVLALREGGEQRRLGMPGSNAVIRFRGTPRGR
ncbi:M23 family metallopeptidase [Candidatus Eisenbacteria bacterium]|uniref:M23 family metallopeptidase n=1 Tax=Eiseniibacteriota bacterium TaxID=2212470 RepID=A0ABV6YLB4_UNCEI